METAVLSSKFLSKETEILQIGTQARVSHFVNQIAADRCIKLYLISMPTKVLWDKF